MSGGWVVLQLNIFDEEISNEILIDSLRSIIKSLEIFIPSIKCKDKRNEFTYSLFDGYVFVRNENIKESEYFKLSNCPYIAKVLSTASGVSYVSDEEVAKLQKKLFDTMPNDFTDGEEVFIEKGIYSGLHARIVSIENEKLLLEIKMPHGSITKLTKIPKMFIKSNREL